MSELLGIPRPTLYRYLREYSVPHFRKSGRIQIPEDSVERIRQARDLHKEGLGTGSVRMRLREVKSEAPDTGELATRLDRLSKELEGLKGDPRALEEASSPHALRTVLARQSLLMSAVFNLTGMVEELMRTNGQPRRQSFEGAGRKLQGGPTELEAPETRLARSRPVEKPVRLSSSASSAPPPSGPVHEFGSLAKQRRRGVAGTLAALVICAVMAWLFTTTSLAQTFDGILPGDWQDEEKREKSPEAVAKIPVPDLSGLTYGEAESRLREAGLAIERRERAPSGGEVVAQKPESGAEVREGEAVAVTLELGGGSSSPGENEEGEASPGASQYGEDVFEYTE